MVFDLNDETVDNFLACVTTVLRAAVDLTEPIFIRSLAELEQMESLDPFAQAPNDDIYERCVTFLPNASLTLPPLPIGSARRAVEIFKVVGCEAYSITRMIGGNSGYAGALIEKLTGVKVTTRNWNTIDRLLNKFI